MAERREALAAAFDELSEDTPEKETVPNEVHLPEKDPLKEPPVLESKEEKEPWPPKKEEEKPKAKKEDEYTRAAKADEGKQTPAVVEGKPPVSWKPAVREQWAKLPAEVRAEISRRETEMQRFVSQNDFHRKFSETFSKVVQPFDHLIKSQNSTPLQAVRNLMTTAAGLMTGSQQQKAEIVRDIINNYSIDIRTLDSVLSGSVIGAPAQQPQQNPAFYDALKPVYGFMSEIQQARQAHEQRRQQEAVNQVEQFADKPYFDDLRDEMADLMEVAANRGIEMTIEQAYQKAVALNPEVSDLITRQKQAEEARRNGGTRLAKARKAASTLTGAPVGAPDGKGAPKTRKEMLTAAYEDRME